MILFCTCKHEYQDKKYGAQNRVHNPKQGSNSAKGYTCTVCGNVKSGGEKK